MSKMNPRPILTVVKRNLTAPSKPDELDQCRVIAEAIMRMEITDAVMLDSAGCTVSVRYRGAARPKPYWSDWTIAQIGLVGSNSHWLAKIGAVVPQTKELTLIPRPDKLDVSLALQAKEETAIHQVAFIRLSVVFKPFQCSRIFHLVQ